MPSSPTATTTSISATSILLLGATGELGSSVLDSLLAQTDSNPAISITAVLRPPSSTNSTTSTTTLRKLRSLPLHLHHVDAAALPPAALASLFGPYDAVISCLGFSAGPGTQLRIAQAALDARVRRFLPWQFGVDYDAIPAGSGQELFDEQRAVRALLRREAEGKGVRWTIVSTGIFMGFVFEEAFGVVSGLRVRAHPLGDGDGDPPPRGDDEEESSTDVSDDPARGKVIAVRALGAWHHGLTATSVEDIGRLTASIILDTSLNHQSGIVYLCGETFTYSQLADLIRAKFESSEKKKVEVKRELWTRDFLREELGRSPEDVMRKYRVAFAANRGVSWEKERTYHAQRSIGVMGLEEWMKKNVVVG